MYATPGLRSPAFHFREVENGTSTVEADIVRHIVKDDEAKGKVIYLYAITEYALTESNIQKQ